MPSILFGPTASGKSALALDWAQKNGGTIINADSLQIYDALPILTAQPDEADKKQAPHRLYGVADPRLSMNAADWAQLAAAEIVKAENVIVAGGTGLYIATLLDGIAPIPPIPPGVRESVTALHDEMGPDSFHDALRDIDSESASKIHPNRREQMIRAREIYEGTGKPPSYWYALPPHKFLPGGADVRLVLLLPDKASLAARAARRFETMLAQGVLDEVRDFAARHGEHAPAAKALGFHALLAHTRGDITLDEAKTRLLQDTSAYIKRQLTWGRQQFAPRMESRLCTSTEEAALLL